MRNEAGRSYRVAGRQWWRAGRSLAVAALLFLAVAPARAALFNPETFTLANGMQVVVVSNHRAPILTQTIYYKVGAADEEDGKTGLAHFLEHLMFKGTKTLKPGEFSAIVSRNGGQENAFTSADYTGYYQTVARDRLELVMKMEADRMSNLTLTPEEIEPERLVVIEERRMRTDNRPSSQLGEQINATLYMNHPYRRPVIGWEREIRDLSIEDIRAFYKKWYGPDNAILVVSGDITAAELKPLAEKYFGPIAPIGVPKQRVRPQEPTQHAARSIVLKDPRVRQPSWSKYYLAPSHTTEGKEHGYPLEVLSQILSSGRTSRMTQSLVIEQKLALGAYAGYDGDALGPASFYFSGNPQPGVDLDKVAEGIEAEIAKLLKDGVTAEEVERAKMQLEDSAAYARDSDRQGARALATSLAIGRTIDDVESWPERIKAVTVEQVNAAARFVLRDQKSVTARLLPASGEAVGRAGAGTDAPPPAGAGTLQ
jgi:zinc protease